MGTPSQRAPVPAAASFPFLVEPPAFTQRLETYVEARRDEIDALLLKAGAVLFRGFDVEGVDAFDAVSRALLPSLQPYVEGQSPRTRVSGNIYTSTEYPSRYSITLHSELSYAKTPPRRILFHCETAPVEGGETPIVDCRQVYRALEPAVRERFEAFGVRYVKHMHGGGGLGKSWSEHFETSSRSEVETWLNRDGIEFEWTAKGGLRTSALRPAMIAHPETGERIWFNQTNLWHASNMEGGRGARLLAAFGEAALPTHAYYGDGGVIEDADMAHVQEVLWGNAVRFAWRRGDVLALDNHLVAHGRMPFEGPRRILCAMG
jgi:hypothetical protein